MAGWTGLVPAGGQGSRLRPFRYAKELLPIAYENKNGVVRPRVVAEFSLDALALAGIHRSIVVVAPWKLELAKYLGDGSSFGLSLAYVYQENARGLAVAIDLAFEWIRHHDVIFAMPDTILTPKTCLATARREYTARGTDVMLAVFPTDEADRLGPVEMDSSGAVQRVHDKCDVPPARNTWGAAIWGRRFSSFLHQELEDGQSGNEDRPLGYFFDKAIRNGMNVDGVFFADGSFADVGTPLGLRKCLEQVALTSNVR